MVVIYPVIFTETNDEKNTVLCSIPDLNGMTEGFGIADSIKMAKEQNLSLNPVKISGVCGRLMCCLQYENDTYNDLKKGMPELHFERPYEQLSLF